MLGQYPDGTKKNVKSFFDKDNVEVQKNFFIGVDKELESKMEKIKATRDLKDQLMKVPEPTVFKSADPIKALHILEKVIIIGNDAGELIVVDKFTFKELSRSQFIKFPIIKIDQQLYAFMAQYKDPKGTIAIFKYYMTASGSHEIKLI